MLSGKFLSALIASPATQHTASKPKKPKKEETAPLSTPDTPNSGGIKGFMFAGLNRMNPPTIIKSTKHTFIHVKKSVTRFDSFTPARTRTVVAIDTRQAAGLIPYPGSSIVSHCSETFNSTRSHSTTLSPQLLAIAFR